MVKHSLQYKMEGCVNVHAALFESQFFPKQASEGIPVRGGEGKKQAHKFCMKGYWQSVPVHHVQD